MKLERESDFDESVWCNIVTRNSTLTIELVYWSPNINEEDITKIQNAIKEVSKGECIIMGDFSHGHIQYTSLESTGGENQQFLFLIHDSFLTPHVLEPTMGENVLGSVLSLQHLLVDNVKILEPLGNSDHSRIYFDIEVKSENTSKKYRRNFHKGKCKDMRKYLAKLDWINMLRARTKRLSKEDIRKIAYKQTIWRVYMRTRKDEYYTSYLMYLWLKLDNLKETMGQN